MVDERDDGGQAFPRSAAFGSSGDYDQGSDGMSLRDYFAAAALQGMLSSEIYMAEIDKTAEEFRFKDGSRATGAQKKQAQINVIARTAYNLADGMLKARQS